MAATASEAQLDIIFYHGAYPLWCYLTAKFGIDIRDICPRVAVEEPKVITELGEYTLRVVPDDYHNGLVSDELLTTEHTQHITFLLNCTNVVFNMLKEGIIRHGEHILHPYSFQLDSNQNLELVLSDVLADELDLDTYAKSLTDMIKLGVHYEAYDGHGSN